MTCVVLDAAVASRAGRRAAPARGGMGDQEFDGHAAAAARRIRSLAPDERIAAACRGSANPAALAWLAEGLRLDRTTRVVDLGAGLGGPAAWFEARYGCTVVGIEPAGRAAGAARSIFDVPMIVATADAAPFAADTFDAVLLLGVMSVIEDGRTVLAEARRLAPGLGLIDYCSTGGSPVEAGGSTFPTLDGLRDLIDRDWHVDQLASVDVPAPAT